MENNILKFIFLSVMISGTPVMAAMSCQGLLGGQTQLQEATTNLKAFKNSISSQIVEREYVIEPIILALLAKEHVLLIGPPGNAKTTLVKKMLSNIVDDKTQQPSFYSMQMNKEITLADTHGSINFKTLSEDGIVKRNYQEGMLGAKLAFTDESFDIRPGALRNLLDVLAERSHSQGTAHFKGQTEMVVSATNKTLSEVYEENNNSEAPRALIDRYSFVVFVPKEMQNFENDKFIFSGGGSEVKPQPIHKLSFQDLDVLRDLVKKVDIPDYIADLASIIHYRLTPLYEAQEVKSTEEYREKIQNGEHSLPPFRASKYMSPRTLSKAGGILKAIVVLDYLEKNGKRDLTATVDDLSKLRLFYQMNGPSEQFLTHQLGRSLKEHEKEQIKALQVERSISNTLFDEIVKNFDESMKSLHLTEIDSKVKSYSGLPNTERRQLVDLLKSMYQRSLQSQILDKENVTFETIALGSLTEIVQNHAKEIFKDKAESVLEKWRGEVSLGSKKPRTDRESRKQNFRYGFPEREPLRQTEPEPDVPAEKPPEPPLEVVEPVETQPQPPQPSKVDPMRIVPAQNAGPRASSYNLLHLSDWVPTLSNASGDFSVSKDSRGKIVVVGSGQRAYHRHEVGNKEVLEATPHNNQPQLSELWQYRDGYLGFFENKIAIIPFENFTGAGGKIPAVTQVPTFGDTGKKILPINEHVFAISGSAPGDKPGLSFFRTDGRNASDLMRPISKRGTEDFDFIPHSKTLVTLDQWNYVNFYEVTTGWGTNPIIKMELGAGMARPKGAMKVTGIDHYTALLWEKDQYHVVVANFKKVHTRPFPGLVAVAASPDRKVFAMATKDGVYILENPLKPDESKFIKIYNGGDVLGMKFTEDGKDIIVKLQKGYAHIGTK